MQTTFAQNKFAEGHTDQIRRKEPVLQFGNVKVSSSAEVESNDELICEVNSNGWLRNPQIVSILTIAGYYYKDTTDT